MASYPNSVKSFTNKASGQNIDPTHINDLQDEVNAIEAGTLNGTARVQSSGLSVLGASTFASRPVMPPPEIGKAYLASTITLGSSALSTLGGASTEFVTNSSIIQEVGGQTRLVPQSTGMYAVAGQMLFSLLASTGQLSIALRDSSGVIIAGSQYTFSSAGTPILNAIGYKQFDALGGYVTLQVGVSGQSTMSLSTGTGYSWFSLAKL